jgi:membrane-bound serine protease (ClpP class)
VLLVVAILAAIFWLPPAWGIAAVSGATALELAEIGVFVWYSKRRRATTGAEGLVGAVGVAVTACDPEGHVRVEGELWKAVCPEGAQPGDRVVVEHVEPGLTLTVALEGTASA